MFVYTIVLILCLWFSLCNKSKIIIVLPLDISQCKQIIENSINSNFIKTTSKIKMNFLIIIFLFIVIVLHIDLSLSKMLPTPTDESNDISESFNNWIEKNQTEQFDNNNRYSLCTEIKAIYNDGVQLFKNLMREITKAMCPYKINNL